MVQYKNEKGFIVNAKMNIRPFVNMFLEEVSKYYDVLVYTASDKEYATAVVLHMDPDRTFIKKILHRRHCVKTEKGFTVKNLKIVTGNEDVSKVILVDNSTHCFAPQINNGIPILPFYYDSSDEELIKLSSFLIKLKDFDEPSLILRQYFGLCQYTKFATAANLVTHLSDKHSFGRPEVKSIGKSAVFG